jgi:hypothetical protein
MAWDRTLKERILDEIYHWETLTTGGLKIHANRVAAILADVSDVPQEVLQALEQIHSKGDDATPKDVMVVVKYLRSLLRNDSGA